MNAEHQITSDEARVTRHGFSLTEVLLAVGILAVGMLFIAGVFPVSIHLTTIASERTIAAVVADEAFAKIQLFAHDPCCLLYAVDFQNPPPSPPFPLPPPPPPPPPFSVSFEDRADTKRALVMVPSINFLEFSYPSTITDPSQKKYWWSAVCRSVGPTDVRVTVFVSRKTGAATTYYMRNPLPPFDLTTDNIQPAPVFVSVTAGGRADELQISDPLGLSNFINDGYTIVDDETGQIYRVLERHTPPNDNVIRLDRDWQGGTTVWVVPPPVGGGRCPCIAVYQKVMRF